MLVMGPEWFRQKHFGQCIIRTSRIYDYPRELIEFNYQNLLDLYPEQRAAAGIFLAFQYPVEIPGVNNLYFLRTAFNSVRKQRGQDASGCFRFY